MSDNTTLSSQVNKLSISESNSSETPPSELVAVVDDLLNQLNSKFSNLSGELIGKLDEMSRRLDSLEANIQAGNEQARDDSDTR
ncbi:hypothetical protein LTR53_012982 [Teratosphaeriaceae sp. CCFEE 6253]|nr:hypothetical protein LTR53_012982 [Teratosphaeriaceae sp. CCFEE 6253]